MYQNNYYICQNLSIMDITQQIINITKAGAYDIVAQHRNELLEENTKLKERVKYLENLIKEYSDKMLNQLK